MTSLAIFGSIAMSAGAQNAPLISRSLYFGISGDDVKSLQLYLAQDKTIYPEGLTTGFFGKLTEAAIKRFQQKYSIEPVGIVGPITRAKLSALNQTAQTPPAPAPTPTVEPTPAPQPAPTPAPTIRTGTGVVSNNRYLDLGAGNILYSGGLYRNARGYLLPSDNKLFIANITKEDISACEDVQINGYRGAANICEIGDASKLNYSELKTAVRLYDKTASASDGKTIQYCYQGILVFKQDNKYIAIDPESVDYEHAMHYKYWVDDSGKGDFTSACKTSSSAEQPSGLASTLETISATWKKLADWVNR